MSWPVILTALEAAERTQGYDIVALIGDRIAQAIDEGRTSVFIESADVPELRVWTGVVRETPLGRAVTHLRSLGYLVEHKRTLLNREDGLRIFWPTI